MSEMGFCKILWLFCMLCYAMLCYAMLYAEIAPRYPRQNKLGLFHS